MFISSRSSDTVVFSSSLFSLFLLIYRYIFFFFCLFLFIYLLSCFFLSNFSLFIFSYDFFSLFLSIYLTSFLSFSLPFFLDPPFLSFFLSVFQILADYSSETLDLNDPMIYRDLSKPMGALGLKRAKQYRDRFRTMVSIIENTYITVHSFFAIYIFDICSFRGRLEKDSLPLMKFRAKVS